MSASAKSIIRWCRARSSCRATAKLEPPELVGSINAVSPGLLGRGSRDRVLEWEGADRLGAGSDVGFDSYRAAMQFDK